MKLFRALGYSVEEALVELWRNRLVNVISIATIAVSLYILGIFLSISANLNDLMEGWASRVHLTLYLEPEATKGEEESIRDILKKSPEVDSFEYVSREAAVGRFRSYFPELQALPDLLDGNPLPASFEVAVAPPYRAPEQVRAFARRLDSLERVAEVDYDLLWIERLSSIIDLARVLGLAVGAALVLASVFTIFNVIKLTVYGRQDEIAIMRLVGATHGYIRGPFLVEGVLQGGLGGLAALGFLFLSHEYLVREALRSFQLLPAAGWLHFIPPAAWLVIVVGGMLVGLLGSLLSVRKFLASPV